MKKELYIGVMSGTSMDGIDTALVEIYDGNIRLLTHHESEMPEAIKQQLQAICLGQPTNLKVIGKLDHQLGLLYANAVEELLQKSACSPQQITAIGNHGQTVFHHPASDTPFTIQLGDANLIAARTGIDTVADFRRKDMALGGQGAPLVPAFHQSVFRIKDSTRVVLNIGGIANISVLRPGQPVIGYDTGPGNLLMDAWCEQHMNAPFDKDAAFARQGQIHQGLLDSLLCEPYLQHTAPKSTGRELFNLDWLKPHLESLSADATDVQRTLCEYTALTIAMDTQRYAEGQRPELLVCGGGAQNPLLMDRLATLLPGWHVARTDDYGVDSKNMEAMAFAWLAYRRMHHLPSNLPEVTGASRTASLGVIYYADK